MERVYTVFIAILLVVIGMSGCSDDGVTSSGSDTNGLAIFLERTGDEDIEIDQGTFANADIGSIRFCYEDEGCEEEDGGSTRSWSGPTRINFKKSDPDKVAVGVIVEFEVSAGEGLAEIVRGEVYERENGFSEFEGDDVVETSEPFSEGDVVEFSYGDTD